jgi:SAM-dependent methyltransferase
MTRDDISFLVSPADRSPLSYQSDDALIDQSGHLFSVVNGIPRFVEAKNYASSFGLQWNLFCRTQIDKYSGTTITRDRFLASTRWDFGALRGQRVLEVGSGAGRFTQIVLDAGADVFSVDYSNAVDANLKNNGPHPHLHLYQADIYALPFKEEYFDKVFCLGVLQHTPNVKKAFLSMIPFLKRGGEIAIDVYRKNRFTFLFPSYYWYRPVTKRMNKEALLKTIRALVPWLLPVSSALLRLPRGGELLSRVIPIANYSRVFPQFSREQILEWAVMDTFDNLAPTYDQPQTLESVRSWFEEAGLEILYCGPGGVGYVGVGRKT